MLRTLQVVAMAIVFAALWSCAQVRSISGGQKDTTPPRILSVSPDSLSTNFQGNSFSVLFDEYVQLRNIQQELLVSPPLKQAPRVQLRQREFVVSWDDTLAQNTTYTFQFGNAISDLNEGNPLPDFSYIFSTGSALDSLHCSGVVRDARLDAPAKAMKVLLYDSLAQVFDKKQRPVYFGRTDDQGNFQLNYLRSGSFLLCALSDENGNYHYDAGESIAWMDDVESTFHGDSSRVTLLLSVPRDSVWTIADYKTDSVGALRFHVDEWMRDVHVRALDDAKMMQWQIGDTIYVSPLLAASSEILYEVDLNGTKRDTVESEYLSPKSTSFKLIPTTGERIRSSNPVELMAQRLVSNVDSSRIQLLEDSIAIPFTIQKVHPNRITITAVWRPGRKYECNVLPGFTKGFDGAMNDTLRLHFASYEAKDLGVLRIKLPECVERSGTIFLLKNKSGEIAYQATDVKAGVLSIAELLPGEYTAEITEDRNDNGIFDPAVISPYQPTEVNHVYAGKITVRANWDVEIVWAGWK